MNYKKVTSGTICLLITAIILSAACISPAHAAYSDVESGAWYSEAVDFVTGKGLFSGVSGGKFAPGAEMTRGMFVTVLGRYAGITPSSNGVGIISKSDVNVRSQPNTSSLVVAVLDKGTKIQVTGQNGDWYMVSINGKTGYVRNDLITAYSSSFSDVGYGSYYGGYVHWAYSAGIVSGTSSSTFTPGAGVNREQLCTLLHNYLKYRGIELQQSTSSGTFTDQAQISSWALASVNYMRNAGVISGRADGSFAPKSIASRAEVAVIMMRFDKAVLNASAAQTPTPSPSIPDEGPYAGYIPFGNVVSKSGSVNMSYFSDALFIGHSIINGMSQSHSSLIPSAGFFSYDGATASGILKAGELSYTGVVRQPNGSLAVESFEKGSLDDALSCYSYSKVYIMLGINEIGGSSKTFSNNVSSIVDKVRTKLNNPKIYIISVTPISREYKENGESFTRANILSFNNALMQLSLTKNVYYLDMFSSFCDANGYIQENLTADGVHLNSAGYRILLDYLRTHT